LPINNNQTSKQSENKISSKQSLTNLNVQNR